MPCISNFKFQYTATRFDNSGLACSPNSVLGAGSWCSGSSIFPTVDGLLRCVSGAIKTDGTLWLWGSNVYGQLGNNATAIGTGQSSPIQTIAGGTNWKQVSIATSILAIKNDGTLWAWGRNNSGQLGINSIANQSSPVQTISGGTNWKQVNVGGTFNYAAAAIKTDGTLWMWGTGNSGVLGNNSTAAQSSPVQTIAGGTNWSQVSVGSTYATAAIKTDGTLWMWGFNNGLLGNNSIACQSSPVQTIAGGTNWCRVSVECSAAGIKTDGTLWVWGSNTYGQLGINSTVNQSSPVQTIAGGTNWSGVSSGARRFFAITNQNKLWSWGVNYCGSLGDGTLINRSSPVQVIPTTDTWLSVTGGSQHTLGVKSDNTLWLWGTSAEGRLGDGIRPTGCPSGTVCVRTDLDDVFVRKEFFSDGGLWLWGCGTSGALGNNAATDRSSPVQTISGGTNWSSLTNAPGTSLNSAIKSDGTLWLWGVNTNGQLGNNSRSNYGTSSPVQTIAGGTNWKQVVHGGGNSVVASIKSDGTLWTWGYNNRGQLGINSTAAQSSPVQTITGGTTWKQVTVGGSNVASIKTDGTLWLWGYGNNGVFGNNALTDRSSPIQTIAGGTNWAQIALSVSQAAAIKTDGTLWTWGRNQGQTCNTQNGGLGDNTCISKSSPIQTIAGGTNWKQVSVGQYSMAAVKTDGTLWLWGQGYFGRRGDLLTTAISSPVQTIAGGTNWKCISNGFRAAAALKTDGTLWVWGYNNRGQLGINSTVCQSSPVQTISGGTNWLKVATGSSVIAGIREGCW